MPNFVDDDHALQVGLFVGLLLRHGVTVELQADADGNYTNTVIVLIPNPGLHAGSSWRVPVTIHPATT